MSRYVSNHIDSKPDLVEEDEEKTYFDEIFRRKLRVIDNRLKAAARKGYLMVVPLPFYMDYCSGCKQHICKIAHSSGKSLYSMHWQRLKCAIGPRECEPFLEMRKISEGDSL